MLPLFLNVKSDFSITFSIGRPLLRESKRLRAATPTKRSAACNTMSILSFGQTRGEAELVCRYCGSDDLAQSFIKRRDRRCRKCFAKRYGSAARTKKTKAKK
jgi:hypothetical protein